MARIGPNDRIGPPLVTYSPEQLAEIASLRARIAELEARVAEAEAREIIRVAHLEEILDIAHEHGGEDGGDGGDGGVTCVGCQRILVLADSALALSSPSPSAYPNCDWTALQLTLGAWNRYQEIRSGQPQPPAPAPGNQERSEP